jgi:hypothetical protein
MKRLRRFWQAPVCIALAGVCLAGCVPGGKPLSAEQRATIHQRAEFTFENAVLLKPTDIASSYSLGAKLAPLFVQEIRATKGVTPQTAPRTVFFSEGEVILAGQTRAQVSYIWQTPGNSSRRGVRIPLNAAGLPVVWEVLNEGSQAQVIFVSQNLEAAALREFGGALPGRHFAVERSMTETPNVVVARVLDDAPVAMGPIVHLDAQGEITTVNCRCMSTQARHLVATAYYELKPLPAVASGNHEILGTSRSRVEKLRLPPAF